MVFKIHVNDEVIILTGRDKGKRGKVKSLCLSTGKAIVAGINIVKKHEKPSPSVNKPGGVVKKESIIDMSNIAIFNNSSNKADHVIFKIKNNKKVRIFKSNGKIIK